MSIRRAIELNFKNRIESVLAGSKYVTVESHATDERPMPCVILVAGNAENPLEGLSEGAENYMVDLSVLILTNIDTGSVDEHNDATQRISKLMSERTTRRQSLVDGLYIYDVVRLSAGDDSGDRKIGSGLNYRVIVNYSPQAT